jgi:hypothetical protein
VPEPTDERFVDPDYPYRISRQILLQRMYIGGGVALIAFAVVLYLIAGQLFFPGSSSRIGAIYLDVILFLSGVSLLLINT